MEQVQVTLQDLMAQRADLERQIAEKVKAGREEGIAAVKALMNQYGLTVADLGGAKAAKTKGEKAEVERAKVAPKFRNAETGEAWTGRGMKPKWVTAALEAGRNLEEFRIAEVV